MMREILFRGKCVDTGVWYEGYYIQLHKTTHCCLGCPDPDNDIHQIVFERMTDWELPNQHYRVDVDPETVGQFTGLTDKNGTKIFEGDILENVCMFRNIVASRKIYVVTFFGGAFGTEQYAHGKRQNNCIPFADNEFGTNEKHCKVIGNIHDNPELMKGE